MSREAMSREATNKVASLRELYGDVRVPDIGVFTRRQVELLKALSGVRCHVPPLGTKSATVLSLQDRGLLRLEPSPGAYMQTYHTIHCRLTKAGVEAVKGIRKVQRKRARRI